MAGLIAVLVVLTLGLLPSSAGAIASVSTPVLGAVVHHHHITVPGVVRAESASHHQALTVDVTLATGLLIGLTLLGWTRRRQPAPLLRPAVMRGRGNRDPPMAG